MKVKFLAMIALLSLGWSWTVQAVDRCAAIFSSSPANHLLDDEQKPQNRKWAVREQGQVTFELSEIIQSVEAHIPAGERSKLFMTVFINGVEQPQKYPWGTKTITLKEPAQGQLDYYIVVKESSVDQSGRATEKKILISDINIRETHDSQNIESQSFRKFTAQDHILQLKISESLKAQGLDPRLMQKAIEKGYDKIVWVLRKTAEKNVADFIEQATQGVSVNVDMDNEGIPVAAIVTDKATGKTLRARPEDFYFKVDAAFNGNAFFWDDMLVSLATIQHHPWLVRSTIDFWLDVQKMNNGVIPREVRKSNLKSLWFDSIVRPGEKEKVNLQYTNPYLIQWVAEKLVAADPSAANLKLMKNVVHSMEEYTQWMEKNRAVYDHGQLIGFTTNALGSGLDNSRGSRGNNHSDESYQSGWVDPLAQQIAMYKSIARWGKYFAESEASLQKVQAKIRYLEYVLNTRYWNREQGFYFDLIPDGHGGFKQDTRYFSVAGFWPLFSGSASPEQVSILIQRQLTANHFGGVFPFPANSLHAIKLDPNEDGYWNGDARWPSMATVAIEGLRTGGRPDVGYAMAVRFLKGMTEANPNTVAEFYGLANKINPELSKGRVGAHAGHETRLDFAGWGKVPPVYLMLEHIIGLSPQLDGRLHWNLMMPMEIGESVEVKNYMYKGSLIHKLSLQKIADDQYILNVESEKSVVIELRSFRDRSGHLGPQAHEVRVVYNNHLLSK